MYDPDFSLWDITQVRRTGFMKRLFGGGSVSHAYTFLHEMSVEFMPRNNGIVALASAGDLFFVSFVEALHWRVFVAWHELNAGIKTLVFSQDGTTLIAERENGRTQTWNLQTLKEKDGEAAHYGVFTDDVSSNGRWHATFHERTYDSDPYIYVSDFTTSNSHLLKEYVMTGIAFSPNNALLAASLDEYYYSYIRLWSLDDPENTLFDVPHQTISVRPRVTEIAFSADSNLVFAVGEKWSLLAGYFGVYDIRSPEGNEVKMVNESASMNALAVSPDGRLLAYGGLDGVIHLMGVPSESLDDKAAQS
jgi:WD40 repeat protein